MRSDISKVLVTTARYGSRMKNGEVRALRRERITEDYDGPRRTSMKPSHHRYCDRKQLNEYLNPLQRFLHKQVGRRWDDVYSEICEHNSRNSAVGAHIYEHLFDYVEVNPTAVRSGWFPARFFVDDDGVLRASEEPKRRSWAKAVPDSWRSTEDELLWYVRRDDGCWFEWRLVPEPDNPVERWALQRRPGRTGFSDSLPWRAGYYGVLRTLTRKEKRALGI